MKLGLRKDRNSKTWNIWSFIFCLGRPPFFVLETTWWEKINLPLQQNYGFDDSHPPQTMPVSDNTQSQTYFVIDIFYFSASITTRKSIYSSKFLWRAGSHHPRSLLTRLDFTWPHVTSSRRLQFRKMQSKFRPGIPEKKTKQNDDRLMLNQSFEAKSYRRKLSMVLLESVYIILHAI